MGNIFLKIKSFLLSLFIKRTVGARALVIKEDEILLVKHTYMPMWYTIGGGVEKRGVTYGSGDARAL